MYVGMYVRTCVCNMNMCLSFDITGYIKTDRKLIMCGSKVVYYLLLVKLNCNQVDAPHVF